MVKKIKGFSGIPRFQIWKQIILVLLLIAAVLFMLDGFRSTRRSAENTFFEHQAIHANQLASEIVFRFDLIDEVLNLWSRSPEFQQISVRTLPAMRQLLEAHADYVSGVTRTDSSGVIVHTIPEYEGSVGADISGQEHMQWILTNREPVLSSTFLTVQGYRALAYHHPCFDSEGRFTGTLAFLIPYERMFDDLFSQLLHDQNIVPIVMDGTGSVLFSPAAEHEGLHYTDAFADDPGLLRVLDAVLSEDTIPTTEDFVSFSGSRSVTMIPAAATFEIMDSGWVLLLAAPEDRILASISHLSNRWLIGMVLIVVLALSYTGLKLRVWITSREEKKWQDVARIKDVMQRTVDQALEIVLILDRKEKVIYANRTAVRLTGFGKRYLNGRIDAVPFEDFKPPIDEIRRRVLRKGSWSGRVEFCGLRGGLLRLDMTVSSVKDSHGVISNFIIIGRDVTAHYEMERRLLEQQKMEAIGQLAGGVAHDFNNLLVGVLGYAELIRKRSGGSTEVKQAADVIIAAVQQATDLTRQLLGYARKGKHTVSRINLARTILKVNELLRRTIDRRISVEFDLDEDIHIKGDASQIEQVILNLTVNARDAMPEGGRLTFSLKRETVPASLLGPKSDGHDVPLAVLRTSDTGVGIHEEYLDRIFEPFFTTKDEEGTGMGLATVYGIVANHGGWMDVDTELGSGTTFSLYLPLDDGEGDPEEHDHDPAADTVCRAGGKILVVDDELVVVETLRELLTEMGYEVETVSGGAEALNTFAPDPESFDAVILDLSMPEMDGKECFVKLREIDPNVHVILATGFSRDGRVQELLDMGVEGFLQKPFRLGELAVMLSRILNN